uniref:Large ribosomal subunit protein bL20c n=2 Tax=Ophioglossum TaxID=13833 RepID=L7SZH9_9MONI|nr:ribosomal protein L20 [Ophioglossum californicum]AGC26735.1 ribosomal protein L20 [Ophioglossum californicum]QXF60108.1 ribosomal protein L20 [Ophioglossum vulgatum]
MTRVKRGCIARRRRNSILKLVSGFRGAHSKLYRTANQQRMKALVYTHQNRTNRKREIRRLWIARISAAARSSGITHNNLINYLYKKQICFNRKVLAQIAISDQDCFCGIIDRII